MSKDNDQWETPQWLFDELNKEFKFDIDLCTNGDTQDDPGNSKLNMWLAEEEDYTTFNLQKLYPESCTAFMNPPYSNPLPFVQKAWEDSKHCKIVMVLKVDPTTKWWKIFWHHYENDNTEWDMYDGPVPGVEVRFLPKRLKYELNGRPQGTAPFPSCIVILDRRSE